MDEKLLSVAEAAELLGVHRTRVNQLIEKGDLAATRIGRAYVIREIDLEKIRERPAPGRPPKAPADDAEQSEDSAARSSEADEPTAVKPKGRASKKTPAKKAMKKTAKKKGARAK
jgi:excisionase family DNA binding protein